MNYFRSHVIAASGTLNNIIVTCDAAFAGLTISCSNGTDTYTETCPSVSPYVVTFADLVADTWTISGTISGQTYSDTVEVTDYFTLELGAGFDWQAWATAGGLDPTDYVDLAALLADELALRRLFLVHASVDYMADVTSAGADITTILNNDLAAKWINLSDYALDTLYANAALATAMDTADKYFYGEWGVVDATTTPPTYGPLGNVPVMTSNSAPYGTASASAVYSTGDRQPYYAFDNNGKTTAWCSGNSSNSAYIQYAFANPVIVKKFKIGSGFGAGNNGILKTFELEASNDGFVNDTHSLGSFNGENTTNVQEFEVNNSDAYLYYRIVTTSRYNNEDFNWVHTIQFYGREFGVSVPIMDTNTTPYGEVSASTELNTNYAAWKAFTPSGIWYPNKYGSNMIGEYIQYEFTDKIVLRGVYSIWGQDTGTSVQNTWTVLGSNDNFVSDVNEIQDITIELSPYKKLHDISNNTPYKSYRLRCKTNPQPSGSNHFGLRLQFYGLDYSEKEFEAGATKKWLYDHGLELETFTAYTTGSGVAEKLAGELYIHQPSAANSGANFYTDSIDLTPYNLVRGIVGEISKSSATVFGRLAIGPTYSDVITGNSWLGNSTFTANNMPQHNAIDISAINQSTRVMFMEGGGTAQLYEQTLTELWLE